MLSYKNLLQNGNPLFLWAIPSDESLHPCDTDVSVVFIKDLYSKVTYCLTFNHPDCPNVNDKVTFLSEFNQSNNKKWVIDKKSFIQLLPATSLLDFNLWKHLHEGKIIETPQFETQAHRTVYRTKCGCGDLNKVVPLLKHKEMFEKMCDLFFETDTSSCDSDVGFQKENEIIIETLAEVESNGIFVNAECFKKFFEESIVQSGRMMYSQYNVYTSTGRPSNHFGGVNYAALNKENGVRKCFVSRRGSYGMMVLIDYSAFHPRIINHLVNFNLSFDEDIYAYLGELYFNRKVTEYDMSEIKSITMRQLYGGVEQKYEHIKYLSHLKEFIDVNWKNFQRDGFVKTPIFGRFITDKHILDPNPNKLFNYILQATETEVALSAVNIVNKLLEGKRTKAVLYTYDSILFDYYKPDGTELLQDIINVLMMNHRFPIKAYAGDSYDSVKQIYPRV